MAAQKCFKPNYFIGIPSSSTSWLSKSKLSLPNDCKVHDRNDLHITVAFLGKISEKERIEALKAYIDQIPVFALPLKYTLNERSAFPNLSNLTSIGFKVGENYENIREFIYIHRQRLYEIGGQKQRDFDLRIAEPHITIARPKNKEQKNKMIDWVNNNENESEIIECELTLNEIALFTWSHSYPQPPLFTKLFSKTLI